MIKYIILFTTLIGISMTTIVIIALDYRELKGRQKCNINNYQDVVFKSKNHNIVQISPPSMCHLSGANFRKANLSYANFHLADLRGADLREANLSHTNLHLADLRGADLREANLNFANLSLADLRKANFQKADLNQSTLHNTNLSSANLSNAILSNVHLSYATLLNANLNYANLSNAILHGADFRGAKLRGTAFLSLESDHSKRDLPKFNNAIVDSKLGKYLSEQGITGFIIRK